MKCTRLALLVLVVIAFGVPVVASISNTRTAFHPQLGFLRMYDTALSGDQLTHDMLEDAAWWHERYSTNAIAGLLGLLLDRRIEVTEVHGVHTEKPNYDVRVYTYFNIPYGYVKGYGAKGGEPTLGHVHIGLNEL